MADPTTTTAPPIGNASANVTYTFEEQAMASCSLYAMSLFCIIIGGIRSANFVKKQIIKKRPLEASISVSEAKKFPFTASLVLFTLYVFFKPNGREWLMGVAGRHLSTKYSAMLNNTLAKSEGPSLFARLASKLPEDIHPYLEYIPSITKAHVMKLLLLLICYEGCVALAALLKPAFSYVLSRLPIGNRRPRLNIPYLLSVRKGNKEMEEGDIEDAKKSDFEYLMKVEVDTHDIVAISICLLVAVSHIFKRHWITNNIIGIAFSIYGIENLHLSSFKAGSLLLAGLFVYDVFWVFATDVMTSVAKGIDAPILLQYPQDLLRHGWKDANKHSMLGLGDIVIPGIFIALLRRFDLRIGNKDGNKKGGGRYFFSITVVAYAAGLLITMLVMHHFKAAQPALLYLVPCCLFVPLLVSLGTGETKELWNYDEEHLTERYEKEKKKVDDAKKTN
ncbi:Signal peptide peptidase [Trichostrongylus colubriformis]|uniref:Signal peptide peptidase n=1 Tax=Trichostrongylus colubriformis TaxID=6319 RepID=A0AAN8IGM8_TRICO